MFSGIKTNLTLIIIILSAFLWAAAAAAPTRPTTLVAVKRVAIQQETPQEVRVILIGRPW